MPKSGTVFNFLAWCICYIKGAIRSLQPNKIAPLSDAFIICHNERKIYNHILGIYTLPQSNMMFPKDLLCILFHILDNYKYVYFFLCEL